MYKAYGTHSISCCELFIGLHRPEHPAQPMRSSQQEMEYGALVYDLYKHRRTEKAKNCGTLKSTSLPKLLHFPFVEIPILEGFYTLYKVRKDGMDAALKWASADEESIAGELYVGPIKATVVTDAAACHKILNSSDSGHLSKPQAVYSRVFITWLHKGLLNSDYDLWKTQRKVMAKSFTFRDLQANLKIANSYGKKLTKDWIELSKCNGNIVQGTDLYDSLTLALIRYIVEVIVGAGQSAKEDSSQFAEVFCRAKDLVVHRFMHPELFIPPIWWLHPNRRELNRLIRSGRAFVMQVISQYEKKIQENPCKSSTEVDEEIYSAEEGYAEDKCLIESMLRNGASSEEIYHQVGTILVAGHETTETALIFLLLDLALNLEHQAKCREEVDSFFNSKSLDSDFDLELKMEDLSELKYLERCLLESMRLTPTVPFFLRRMDTQIQLNDAVTIKSGSTVLFSPWLIHRNPKYYPNPEKFEPDRFLPENVKRREPGSYIPFSGGPRNCIGYKSAINQMKVVMTWILRHFEIISKDKRSDVKILFDVTTRPERHYKLILKRRTL